MYQRAKGQWIVVGILAVLGLGRTAPLQASTTVIHSTIDFSSFACPAPGQENGEPVTGTGDCVTVATVTTNPNGGFHAHFEFSCHGTAVGQTSGTNFVFNQAGVFDFDTTPGAATTGTQVSNFHLISQGSAPNQLVEFLFHGTIDANGVPTVFVDNFRVVCQG